MIWARLRAKSLIFCRINISSQSRETRTYAALVEGSLNFRLEILDWRSVAGLTFSLHTWGPGQYLWCVVFCLQFPMSGQLCASQHYPDRSSCSCSHLHCKYAGLHGLLALWSRPTGGLSPMRQCRLCHAQIWNSSWAHACSAEHWQPARQPSWTETDRILAAYTSQGQIPGTINCVAAWVHSSTI